jgi:predicted Rossmann fold flavoprotein
VRIGVIGGGAAGIFGAIAAASESPNTDVVVFEATGEPLDKVRVSGGGRCNVTHHCFDPAELIKGYPRGYKELRGPFSRFQPRDTVTWFESRGVQLKAEADGRMFPVTDSSSTIIDALLGAARKAGVRIRLNSRVREVRAVGTNDRPQFEIDIHDRGSERVDRILIATGSAKQGHRFAEALGHSIVPCVPSLFTFKVKDRRLEELAGVSFERVRLILSVGYKTRFEQVGPMLITHWGLSGPAIIKLSAWAARPLADQRYHARLGITFVPDLGRDDVNIALNNYKSARGKKRVIADGPYDMPRRYWMQLCRYIGIDADLTWSNITKSSMQAIVEQIIRAEFNVTGKGIFKEEFVTCGGVSLKEIDFSTMQSKICAGVYFAGEVLDVDGITGGFNFQSAWTTGWLAGKGMGESFSR